jgi:hypothetical protein
MLSRGGKAALRSHQFGQRINDDFNLFKESQDKLPIGGSICIERFISLNLHMPDGNMQTNFAIRLELEVRIGFGNLEDAHWISVFQIPSIDVEGRFLTNTIYSCELYIDHGWSSESDGNNLVLIPIRKLGEDTQEGRKSWVRTPIEGLKSKDRISYRIRDTGEFSPTPFFELSRIGCDDKGGPLSLVGIGTGNKTSDGENQVIQRVSHVGHAITENKTPTLEVGGIVCDLQPKPKFGELVIALEDNLVRISLHPCVNFTIDNFEVVARPS